MADTLPEREKYLCEEYFKRKLFDSVLLVSDLSSI